MGLLQDQMALDGEAVVDPDDFAEAVTYTPLGGSPVAIHAIVDRNAVVVVPGSDGATTQSMTALIRNHATLGRSSINTGGDTVTVSWRRGGTALAHPVVAVVEQGPGWWLLQLGS